MSTQVDLEQGEKTAPSQAYFAEKHRQLADAYQGNCLTVARDLARLLLAEGKKPSIALLVRKKMMGDSKYYGPLIPKKYRGRTTWTKHYVCCCDGQVFDPILERPIEIESYSQQIFGLEIPVQTYIPSEIMERYVGRASSNGQG
jgi:hypothetical protein